MLLIVLGVLLIGIAIAVGIFMFGATSVQSNKDAIVEDLQSLAANAISYRSLPVTMGGGSPSYTGYVVPPRLLSNDNASYAYTVAPQSVTFVATSAEGYGTITTVLDSTGQLGSYRYSGEFQ
jgi:hypothetical protein